MRRVFAVILLLLFAGTCEAAARGYYRYPAIHGNTLVFTAEGDLWKVPLRGGEATRLTTHLGQETRAAISPDGKTVAFTAHYEGAGEVYTIPIAGGRPSRITFDGETANVIGWTGQGRIIYATRHFSTLPNTQLVTVDPKTRAQTVIALAQASDGVWNPTGTLFFTRLGKQGSSTKRYKGGWVENIWSFPGNAKEAIPLTGDFKGTSRNPMWNAGRIYFASDRDGTMNLWSMNEAGKDLKQHTKHKGFDVLSPNMSHGKIAYQHGADLRVFDVKTGKDRLVPITLTSDFDQTRPTWIKKPLSFLTSLSLSPNGDRVALTARGRVFVAPTQQGRFVEVTRKQGVRYRGARFTPDGKSLIALSDESGELEFWRLAPDGFRKPRRITRAGRIFRYAAVPSPDGERFAYRDKNNTLWITETKTGNQKRIAKSDYGGWSDHGNFSGLTWSPDSRYLAYVDAADNNVDRVFLYDTTGGRALAVTTDRFDSFSPAFSPDGKWLYLLSNRNLVSRVRSPWGALQPDPYFPNRTNIYHIPLQPGLRSPFAPDLETARKDTKKKPARKIPAIDFDGIAQRIRKVPVPAGNYERLTVNGKQLFWAAYEDSAKRTQKLMTLTIGNKKPKPVTLVSGIRGFQLSADGSKLLIHKGDTISVVGVTAKAITNLSTSKINLSNWKILVDPKEEWRQMFVDAWRMERDYFYDRSLHGRDWKALRDRHIPLLDRVTDRAELNDLIKQLVGELEALHIYVRGGDHREGQDKISPASLGAVLKRDDKAGGYRVAHIYRTDPDLPDKLSPLSRAHVPVKIGDVILAINGVLTRSVAHPHLLLRNESGRPVRMIFRRGQKTMQTTVTPISQSAAAALRYSEWEYTRRLQVEKTGNGKIGYVHLRAMGSSNIAEWARHFYPVFNRQGLIIDVRNNRGGNIDSWILGKLIRKAWFYWKPRVGKPQWNMQYAFRGHIVVLCNAKTASDGEAFTEGIRRLKLGTVIGTRTWGGEIWLSFNNRLVDRGIASAAQTGVYGPERQWLIEGHGVDPDITVDNLPHATFKGRDAQLEAALTLLKRKIGKDPRAVPKPPEYPNKEK